MNAPTIFLLATVLLGLCGAQVGPVIDSNPGNGREVVRIQDLVFPSTREVIDRLRRLVPEAVHSVAGIPENLAKTGLKVAYDQFRNLDSDGRTAVTTFVNNVKAFLADILKRIQDFMLRITKLPNTALQIFNKQGRTLNLLTAPMQTLGDMMNCTATSIHNGFQMSLTEIMRTFWNFLLSVLLPGMHRFLNDLASTQLLPTAINTMVQNFNLLYGILKMLGYVPA